MHSLDLQGFSYSDRAAVLSALTDSLTHSGAWITDRDIVSATTTSLRFEIQLGCVLDLYMALIATGLELTRTAHLAMTELWTRFNHLHASGNEVVVIQLEVNFLEHVTIPSLLATGAGLA